MNKVLRFLGNNSRPFGINGLDIYFSSDWISITKMNDKKLWLDIGLQKINTLYAKEQTCSGISRNIVNHSVIINKNRLF